MILRKAPCCALLLTLATAAHAATIQYDFGNGTSDANTGVPANVVIAENAPLSVVTSTMDGVTLTLTPVVAAGADFGNSLWGSNTQGIGVRSRDTGGSTAVDSGANGGQRRRIGGDVGEAIQFSFDTDVTIDTVRLGSLAPSDDTGSGVVEVVELSFVSGVDPFSGAGPLTIMSDTTLSTSPIEDLVIDTFVEAGTVLQITTNAAATTASGILFNDIVVSTVIPEPAATTLALLGALGLLSARRR